MLLIPLRDTKAPGISIKDVTFILIVFTIFIFILSQFYIQNLTNNKIQEFLERQERCKDIKRLPLSKELELFQKPRELMSPEDERYLSCLSYFHTRELIALAMEDFETYFQKKVEIDFFSQFGVVPGEVKKGYLFPLISGLFLHIGILHLLFNMWFLWVFGPNLEFNLGTFRFLIFYLLTGALAFLIYSFVSPDQEIPVIGASGAISGLLGSYLILYPHNQIKTFVFIPLPGIEKLEIMDLPWVLYIGIWFLFQFIFLFFPGLSVAFLAHILGFIIGLILIFFFRRRIIVKHYQEE